MRSSAKYIWWFVVLAFVGSFLLYETSGLAGGSSVTTSTAVATVNGEDVLLTNWQRAVSELEQQEQQRLGHALSMDERRVIEDQAYDQLVNDVLLRQEYERRGISVTDDEIRQAALSSPPPGALQSPDLQTDGKFDPAKYQRLLASSQSAAVRANLEAYYRSEIPRQKLFDQVSNDVYLSDERLWQIWRDRHDSATISFVSLRTSSLTDTAVTVTDAEIQKFYDRDKKKFLRPGRAVMSLLTIPRVVTTDDSTATRARIERLRAEIVGGAKFEDVARRESADSGSAVNGGSLGKGTNKGRFVKPFEDALNTLKPGEVSQPVLTVFGWHLIKLDGRQGDTLDARHIQLRIAQTDSSASRTDKRADSLASIAGSLIDQPVRFDSAAKVLGLTPASVIAFEKEPLSFAGRAVPGASAWAFSGTSTGETSDLLDAPDAYFLVRLDSLQLGGQQPLSEVKDEIRRRIAVDKRVEKLLPQAQKLATAAAASGLEAAAAQANLTVEKSKPFARVELVDGLGQFTEAIGASFRVPVGKVSPPVAANDAMIVLRVDSRTEASKPAFEAQKASQRGGLTQQLRQQRVEEYMVGLRESNKIEDHRVKVMSALRRQATP
ncbi:MAG: peptidyl-prolyl cis-trans isomerase [Phycisphaerae bacterium]|nr:peptidyl-prolyl cis-trans isomerase [Gemmatimonadaceae bacterium]